MITFLRKLMPTLQPWLCHKGIKHERLCLRLKVCSTHSILHYWVALFLCFFVVFVFKVLVLGHEEIDSAEVYRLATSRLSYRDGRTPTSSKTRSAMRLWRFQFSTAMATKRPPMNSMLESFRYSILTWNASKTFSQSSQTYSSHRNSPLVNCENADAVSL